VPVNVGDASGAYAPSSALNPAPLTVPLADRLVNAPVFGVVDPIGPGAAKVDPPSVAALMLVLHAKPVAVVQFSALADVLQLGTAMAVGLAIEPVALASTVLAACVARSVVVTSPVAVRLPVTVGVAIVGEVARTGAPDPVTGFASAAATPVPSPETPVEMGSPVPFVSVTDEGVPRAGVVSVGEFDNTTEPVPVEVVVPVPPPDVDSGFCNVRELNVGVGNV